jgi:putative endonuclease
MVVARNYRPAGGHGEIDLVVRDGSTLVFVEVKTRAGSEHGAPESAVDREKREALIAAARSYARRVGADLGQARFDIVSVQLLPKTRVEWIRDAFRASGM